MPIYLPYPLIPAFLRSIFGFYILAGSLQLDRPVIGPTDYTLYIKMEASNLNRVIVTSQIAVVNVIVSPYLIDYLQ